MKETLPQSFQGKDGDVVALLSLSGKFAYALQKSVDSFAASVSCLCGECFNHPLLSILFHRRIHGFGNAIGVEE